GTLLALGEIHALGLILLAAFLEHDVRGHRARTGAVIKRQHDNTSFNDELSRDQTRPAPPGQGVGRRRLLISSTTMLLSRSASPARMQASHTSRWTVASETCCSCR